MGSETEEEATITSKLPLLLTVHAHMESPERSGTLTPPIHSLAAVPFRWEQEPGKPKPCALFSNDFSQKSLELPPRLITKLPSPTTVLESPYSGRSLRFPSSSFRVSSECYGSFRSYSPDHETEVQQPLGASVLGNRGVKGRGILSYWRRRGLKGKREIGGGSYVFPSSVDRDSESSKDGEESSCDGVKITRIRRAGSFSNISPARFHFWTSICEGLKQVVPLPWKRKKVKRNGLVNLTFSDP
ncbi:uncharacterized protein At4g00950-like [Carica papaya]|uniref:uncharacterized protein At4g00950-like n=1 Tax=Carica papaya TaxID=3649 RepID=UPI000B8CE722|nr:uncharacterized protein At4g00950-like [Carica papaya]